MARPIRVSILADPKDFVSGMQAAEQAAEQIEQTLEGTEQVFASLDNTMGKISEAADFVGGEFGRVGAGLSGVGDRIAEMNPEWEAFGHGLSEAGKNLTLVSDAADVVTGTMNMAQAAVGLLKDGQLAQTVATKAAAVAQWAMNAALTANPIGVVVMAIAALVAGIVLFFTQTEVGRKAWSAFTSWLTDVWRNISKFFSETWDKIVELHVIAGTEILKKWDGMVKWFSELPGNIAKFFADLPKNLVKIGGDLITGLWDGINDKVDWVKDKIGGFTRDVEKWFKDFFGIASPSRMMADLGRWIPEGLAQGIDANLGVVDAAMADLTGLVTDADLTTNLANDALRHGGTVNLYSFDGNTWNVADEDFAEQLEEFIRTLQRQTRTGV